MAYQAKCMKISCNLQFQKAHFNKKFKLNAFISSMKDLTLLIEFILKWVML